MPPLEKQRVIQEVGDAFRQQAVQVERLFQQNTPEALEKPASDGGWSALACIEHLNRFCRHYVEEVEKKLDKVSKEKGITIHYSPGLLGNQLTNSMAPKEGVIGSKMKTLGRFDARKDQLQGSVVLDQFQEYQYRLGRLLEKSKDYNWDKVRVKSAVGPLIQLKLGDVFRATAAHNARHILQAERAVNS